MAALKYTVVRYIPDQARDEAVNLGVLAVSETPLVVEGHFAEMSDIRRRLGAIGNADHLDSVKRFISYLQGYFVPHQRPLSDGERSVATYRHLVSAASEWGGIFRLTPLRPCAFEDAQVAARALFDEFVAPRRAKEKLRLRDRRRDRRHARSLIVQLVKKARQEAGGRETVGIECDAPLEGKVDTHTFPVVARNGQPLRAADALSLELRNEDAVREQIRLLAWQISDVRAQFERMLFVIGCIGDRHSPGLFQDAKRVLGAQNAEVVPEEELESLAAEFVGAPAR